MLSWCVCVGDGWVVSGSNLKFLKIQKKSWKYVSKNLSKMPICHCWKMELRLCLPESWMKSSSLDFVQAVGCTLTVSTFPKAPKVTLLELTEHQNYSIILCHISQYMFTFFHKCWLGKILPADIKWITYVRYIWGGIFEGYCICGYFGESVWLTDSLVEKCIFGVFFSPNESVNIWYI